MGNGGFDEVAVSAGECAFDVAAGGWSVVVDALCEPPGDAFGFGAGVVAGDLGSFFAVDVGGCALFGRFGGFGLGVVEEVVADRAAGGPDDVGELPVFGVDVPSIAKNG